MVRSKGESKTKTVEAASDHDSRAQTSKIHKRTTTARAKPPACAKTPGARETPPARANPPRARAHTRAREVNTTGVQMCVSSISLAMGKREPRPGVVWIVSSALSSSGSTPVPSPEVPGDQTYDLRRAPPGASARPLFAPASHETWKTRKASANCHGVVREIT